MQNGRKIMELPEAAEVKENDAFILEKADGTGTKRTSYRKIVEGVAGSIEMATTEDIEAIINGTYAGSAAAGGSGSGSAAAGGPGSGSTAAGTGEGGA